MAYTWSQLSVDGVAMCGAFGGGKFVLITTVSGVRKAAVSTDNGATWSYTTISGVSGNRMKYINGFFFVFGADGNPGMYRSTNGTTWTDMTASVGGTSVVVKDVAWNGTTYVVTAYKTGTGAGPRIYYSTTGTTWTLTTAPAMYVETLFWNGTVFVALGFNTGTFVNQYSTSADGITWSSAATGGFLVDTLSSVPYGNNGNEHFGTFDGKYYSFRSPDGVSGKVINNLNSTFTSSQDVFTTAEVTVSHLTATPNEVLVFTTALGSPQRTKIYTGTAAGGFVKDTTSSLATKFDTASTGAAAALYTLALGSAGEIAAITMDGAVFLGTAITPPPPEFWVSLTNTYEVP